MEVTSPKRGKKFFSSQKLPERLCGPPTPWELELTGDKVARHDVDHTRRSSAEATNEWSCTSAAPICLHCADRKNFTFSVSIIRYP